MNENCEDFLAHLTKIHLEPNLNGSQKNVLASVCFQHYFIPEDKRFQGRHSLSLSTGLSSKTVRKTLKRLAAMHIIETTDGDANREHRQHVPVLS